MKMPRKRKVPIPAVIEEENEEEVEAEMSKNTTTGSGHLHQGPMYSIMSNVQLNETFHKKYIREMSLLYQKMDHDAFMFTFIKMVKSAMEGEETNEYAYTTLLFCAKFVASYDVDDTHPVLVDTCRWLLTTISQNPHIRFRLCQFVNMILNALGVEAALDDAICDGIMEYMLRRLRDINPNVRVQAILALQRLQCPDNPDDVVLRVYQFHLCSDPSPRVRQAVVTSMGRNYNTIPYILDRLWDIDEKVRRHTYLHMSGYPVRAYKVSQRLQLLEQGLNDRSEMVKKVVTTIMLPQWLESYNKNYILFVSALKLDASEAEVERFLKIAKVALHEIFKRQSIEDLVNCVPLEEDGDFHKCVPHDKLSMEVTLYWQCLIEHLSSIMADELDMIIPELSTFCAYVLRFCEAQNSATDKFMKMEFQYVLLSLCEILYLYDLGDEIGRENLKKIITTILKSNELEEKIIEVIVKCTENLITDQNSRLQFFVEIIEEITHTSSFKNDTLINDRLLIDELLEKHPDKDLKLKLSSLKVKILDLEEQEMNYVEMKDYVQAHRITEEKNVLTEEYTNLLKPLLEKHSATTSENPSGSANSLSRCFQRTKKVTTETIIKSLQIAFYMVVSKNVRSLTPNVCKLYNEFIGRHIASNQIAIRDWALKCGTAYSMLYEALAKEIYEVLYAQFFKNHNIRIWKTSITCIFELLDRYGCSSFNVEERQNKSKRNGRQLYNTLEFLDAEDESSVWSSGQAVDIIFMMSHFLDTCDDVCIISAIVNGFCRLVLHDHIKNSEILEKLLLRYFNPSTDAEINQILGVFLENLIQRKKQEYLHPCLLPTISQVISAPYESPLHEIKPETVMRFVIDATRPEFCSPAANIHNKLALSFLQEMQNNIANKDLCKILSKELITLEMCLQDDQALKAELKGIAEKLINCEFDSKTMKSIIDFKDMMDGVFNPPMLTANVEGSDDEDKSDDENASQVTTEKEFEKVTSNETTSNRLQPVFEEEESEVQTLVEELTNGIPVENENSEENSADKENTTEQETLTEKRKSNENTKTPRNKKRSPEKSKTTEKKKTQSQRKQTRQANAADKEKEPEPEPTAEPPPTPRHTVPADLLPPPPSTPAPIGVNPPSTPFAAAMMTPLNNLIRHINTPTTFGRENSTGLRYLRKSMNSSRQNTHPDDGPSPKIRIEARIDTIVSPLHKVAPTTVERIRQTRQKLRALANPKTPDEKQQPRNRQLQSLNENETQSSKSKQVQSAKDKKKANAMSTRKTAKKKQQKEKEAEEDSDELEVIPASPTSSPAGTDVTLETTRGSTRRRFNRALRFNNIQIQQSPAPSAKKVTQSNSNNTADNRSEKLPEPPKRNTRKRPISPNTPNSNNEGGKEYPSPLRKQSKTSIHLSENTTKPTIIIATASAPNTGNNTKQQTPTVTPTTTTTTTTAASINENQETPTSILTQSPNIENNNSKDQTPVTDKLRAKNSNVPETEKQNLREKSTRKKNKPKSPSSKENEPKSPSKSPASLDSSSELSSLSASDYEAEQLPTKTPKNKRRSNNYSITNSAVKRIINKKNPVLSLRRSIISASASRVSTRNSARKDRQNNMIMTRKRLSLESVRSPKTRQPTFIAASPKTKSKKKNTPTVTVVAQPKVSKIPVNIALRTNKSNTSLNKSKMATSSSVLSNSSNVESEAGSENTTSTRAIAQNQQQQQQRKSQTKAYSPVNSMNASSSSSVIESDAESSDEAPWVKTFSKQSASKATVQKQSIPSSSAAVVNKVRQLSRIARSTTRTTTPKMRRRNM